MAMRPCLGRSINHHRWCSSCTSDVQNLACPFYLPLRTYRVRGFAMAESSVGPAFILGNGPDLPIESLGLLDGFLTIGTNRVLQIYQPTCLLWLDGSVWPDIANDAERTEAVLVCGDDVGIGTGSIRLRFVPETYLPSPDPWTLHGCHNTAVTAAFWARALGCSPVYLLGCLGAHRGDLTNHPRLKYGNYYGLNPNHCAATLRHFKRSFAALLAAMPDCARISHAEELRSVLAYCLTRKQPDLRRWLRDTLEHCDGRGQTH